MASNVPRPRRFTKEFQKAEKQRQQAIAAAQENSSLQAEAQAEYEKQVAQYESQQALFEKYQEGTLNEGEFKALFEKQFEQKYGTKKAGDAASYAYYKYRVSKGYNLDQDEERNFAVSGFVIGKEIRKELGGGLNKVVAIKREEQKPVADGGFSPLVPASMEQEFVPISNIPESFVDEKDAGNTYINPKTGQIITGVASNQSGGIIAVDLRPKPVPPARSSLPVISTQTSSEPKSFIEQQYETGLKIQETDKLAGFGFNLLTGVASVPFGIAELALNPVKTGKGVAGLAKEIITDPIKTSLKLVEEQKQSFFANPGFYAGAFAGSYALGKVSGKIIEPTKVTIKGTSVRQQIKGVPGGSKGVVESEFTGTVETNRLGALGEKIVSLGKKGSIAEQLLTKKQPITIKQSFVVGRFGKLEKFGQEAESVVPPAKTLLDVRAIGRTAEAELKPQAEAIKLQLKEGLKVRTTGVVKVNGKEINIGTTTKQSTNDLVGLTSKNEKFFPAGKVERETIALRKGRLGVKVSSGNIDDLTNRSIVRLTTGRYVQRAKGVKVEGGPYSGFTRVRSETKATIRIGNQRIRIIEGTETIGKTGRKSAITEYRLGEKTAREIDVALRGLKPYRGKPFSPTLTDKYVGGSLNVGKDVSTTTVGGTTALETSIPISAASAAPQVVPTLTGGKVTQRTAIRLGSQANVTRTQSRPVVRSQPRIITKPSPSVATRPSSISISSPITTPRTQPVTQPVTQPITKPSTSPITQPIFEPVVTPITKPVTRPITKPVTQPITQPVTQPITKSVSIPVTTAIVRSGRVGRERSPQNIRGVSSQAAYAVQTKRGGKIVTLGARLTRKDAFAYGSRLVAGTLRASFRVVRAAGSALPRNLSAATTPFKRNIKTGFNIEPKSLRLKTKGETREIQGFRRRSGGLRL